MFISLVGANCVFGNDIRLYNTAIRLGKLQEHFKLQINPEEYAAENLKFGLMEVVYEWAKVCYRLQLMLVLQLQLFELICFYLYVLKPHTPYVAGHTICRYL